MASFLDKHKIKYSQNVECVAVVFGNTAGSLVGKILFLSSNPSTKYQCRASHDTLGFYLGVSRKTILRTISLLETNNLIIDHTPKYRNDIHRYTVNKAELITMNEKYVTFTNAIEEADLTRTIITVKKSTETFSRYDYNTISYQNNEYVLNIGKEETLNLSDIRNRIAQSRVKDSIQKLESDEKKGFVDVRKLRDDD